MSRNLGRLDDGGRYLEEALRLSDSMTERQQLATRGYYFRVIPGELRDAPRVLWQVRGFRRRIGKVTGDVEPGPTGASMTAGRRQSYGYLPEAIYYQGRTRETLGRPDAEGAYREYLVIRGDSARIRWPRGSGERSGGDRN